MVKFYSQHGEDFLLWQLFKDTTEPGYFVEVGALDGLRFTNTYTFEEAGWRGICIEAHPDYIELLNQNRPGSVNVFAAAGEYDGEVTFYTNSRGALSSLDASQEEYFKERYGKYFTGFKPVQVPILKLDTILKDADAPTQIDILSIDVEGAELRVLDGLDFKKYQPRVLVIEAAKDRERQELINYLEPLGYKMARNLHPNAFFCHDEKDVKVLTEVEVTCTLHHTPHILDDNTEAEIVHITQPKPAKPVESPKPTFWQKVIYKLTHLQK